jgi:hypothetical protein
MAFATTYIPKPRNISVSSLDLTGVLVDTDTAYGEENWDAIQATLDKAATFTGKAKLRLPPGLFVHDKPIRMRAGVGIAGAGGADGTRLKPGYGAGVGIVWSEDVGACPHGPALLAGDDWSWDFKLESEAGHVTTYMRRFLDYSQMGVHPRNWTQLNFECVFRPHYTGSFIDTETMWVIGGKRTAAEGYVTPMQVYFLASGTMIVLVTIGGVIRSLSTAVGAVANNTTYYMAVDYDGFNLRLWFGAPGAALAAPVQTIACTGVFTSKAYQVPCMGNAAYSSFPEPNGEYFKSAPVYVGWHRFGPTSKRSAAFTAPSSAIAPTSTDWICAHPTTDGPYGKEVGELYYTIHRGNIPGWMKLMRNSYSPLVGASMQDIFIYGGGAGSRTIGVHAVSAIESELKNVRCAFVGGGLHFMNNCYQMRMRDCSAVGGAASWGGPANSEIWPRVGIGMSGASGVMTCSQLRASAFGYGFGLQYVSLSGGGFWPVQNYECGAIISQPGNMTIDGFLIADEGNTVAADYGLLVELTGTGTACRLDSLIVEAGTYAATVPIGISGSGNPSQGDYHTPLEINGGKVVLNNTTPQAEVIHFLDPANTRPIVVNSMVVNKPTVPLSLAPGKVIRDGVASPVNVTDANATHYWHQGPLRLIPAGLLTADRTATLDKVVQPLGDPTPPDLMRLRYTREDASRFTYSLKNGAAGSVIFTFPPGKTGWQDVRCVAGEWTIEGEAGYLDQAKPNDTISTTTSNATPVDVRTYTVPSNTIRDIVVVATGHDNTDGTYATGRLVKEFRYTVVNDGGTVTQEGSDIVQTNHVPAGWGLAHSETGATTKLTVTGDASNVVAWTIKVWWEDRSL